MKKPVIIVLILAVIAVGVGVYFMTRPAKNNEQVTTSETKTSTTSPDTNTDGTPSDTNNNQDATTITYTDEGFSPESVTIKAGGQIKFINNSSRALQVGSDPHPQHTDNEELNAGTVAKGESVTVTLSTVGTWNYHNHLSSDNGGTVIVE